MKKSLLSSALCGSLCFVGLFSCGDDDEANNFVGCVLTIEDVQSIIIPGEYVKDTSNVACNLQWCTKIYGEFYYLVGEAGEWYCIHYEPTFDAYHSFHNNFADKYHFYDKFELEAKVYEYDYDEPIMKHQMFMEPWHWEYVYPQDSITMYTVNTTEMKLWHIDGETRELVQF